MSRRATPRRAVGRSAASCRVMPPTATPACPAARDVASPVAGAAAFPARKPSAAPAIIAGE
eukprot:10774262-Alexandrium_andersonii.AAC.1